MFVYAFYLRMKRRFPGVRIDLSDMVHYHVHHGYEMNRVFGLPQTEFCINQPLKKVLEFLFFKKIYERKQPPGTLRPYERRYLWPLLYFKGFYQSERYFRDIADEVRRAFTFDLRRAGERTREMQRQIDGDPLSVSLHVRRGDYLLPKHYANVGTVCGLPYYRHAVDEICGRVEGARFYVFSDDPAWARENLPVEAVAYIDWNTGEDSWQDMFLMSRCRHHIICNSTFSWWGAWLDPRPDKVVIAPERWFAADEAPDIIPEGWVKVPVK